MAQNAWQGLNRRVAAMHSLWRRAVTDVTLDQVNHHEREGVVPIAFSLMHFVNNEDRYVTERLVGGSQLWEDDGWAERVGGNVPQVRRGAPLVVAEGIRFGDLAAWRAYQEAVFARTEAAMAELPDERFDEVVFPQVPEAMRGGFLSMLAGDGPVRLGDLMDVVLYQHGMRHLGEVEHARSLVGLGGLD
ncbi:MAG: hypothetical protein QOF01_3295 [Thermomicrobiales bacterium]|jgi:hypothetical protein|nr:hypothetical protein [Thermomicrobiales bacterium]